MTAKPIYKTETMAVRIIRSKFAMLVLFFKVKINQ